MMVPTPHNSAKNGEIAKTVIMPGDPLRAKYIAKKYLEDVFCYNEVRGMFGFTGKYKGIDVSVQASGMGVPSMGIYSKELFEGYDVDNIIRIGTAGCLANPLATDIVNDVKLRDIVVAKNIYTDSNYLNVNGSQLKSCLQASKGLLRCIENVANQRNVKLKIGDVYTTDTFYSSIDFKRQLSKENILAIEMETLALYVNAINAGKSALALYTISDNAINEVGLSSKQREESFTEMMELALETAIKCK
ncbi:MAG: purine-nucleoside phosphorylase [Clostridia bacterium]